jgi:putative flippase GtrA
MQLIKFTLVGLLNTALSYFLFVFCIAIGLGAYSSSVISYILTIAFSFEMNRYFVFPSATKAFQKGMFIIFLLTNLLSLSLSISLLWLFLTHLKINIYISQVLCVICSSAFNFFSYRAILRKN